MSKAAEENSGNARTAPQGRRAVRHRTLKSGKILSLDKTRVFDCQIRNLSDTGALLVVAESAWIPKEFFLKGGDWPSPVRCRVARRTSGGIGVEFVEDSGGRKAP